MVLELAYYILSYNSKLRATINASRSLTDWVHTFITKIQKLKQFDMKIRHQEKHAHSCSPQDLWILKGLRIQNFI